MSRIAFQSNPNPGFFSQVFAIVTLCLFCGWFYILTISFGLSIVYIIYHGFNAPYTITFWIFVISSMFWPAKRWDAFYFHPLWQTWRDYLQFEVIIEGEDSEYKPEQQYILAEYPHGVFPLGSLLGGTTANILMPHHTVDALVASINFRIPFMRHFFSWSGGRPATRSNLQRILKEHSCAIVVGGIAEIFMSKPDEERIFLKKRKGFVISALNSGAHIVPCYILGQTALFKTLGKQHEGSFLARISRQLRASLIFFYGRWGLPIPFRQKVIFLVGKPIPVPKVEQPDSPQIDQIHYQYMESLKEMYDKHKHRLGWQNRPLHIV